MARKKEAVHPSCKKSLPMVSKPSPVKEKKKASKKLEKGGLGLKRQLKVLARLTLTMGKQLDAHVNKTRKEVHRLKDKIESQHRQIEGLNDQVETMQKQWNIILNKPS